jgi:hypothetical protein
VVNVAETRCGLALLLIDVPASCSSWWRAGAGSCEILGPVAATTEINADRSSGHPLGPQLSPLLDCHIVYLFPFPILYIYYFLHK